MARDRFIRWGVRQSRIKRRLRNPYFSRRPSRLHGTMFQGWRGIGFGVAGAAAIAALVILPIEAWSHPAFTIHEVRYDLTGLLPERQREIHRIVERALSESFLGHFSRWNYFLAPAGDIREAIAARGPYADVRVQKDFPNGLEVFVRQPMSVFLLRDGQGYATADERGVVLDVFPSPAATSTESGFSSLASSTLVAVTVLRAASSTDQFQLDQEGITRNCATLITFFDNNIRDIGMKPTDYRISADATSVSLITAEQTEVLLDPVLFTPMEQMERLAAFLRDPRNQDRRKIEYIDVRYQDRVYARMRE